MLYMPTWVGVFGHVTLIAYDIIKIDVSHECTTLLAMALWHLTYAKILWVTMTMCRPQLPRLPLLARADQAGAGAGPAGGAGGGGARPQQAQGQGQLRGYRHRALPPLPAAALRTRARGGCSAERWWQQYPTLHPQYSWSIALHVCLIDFARKLEEVINIFTVMGATSPFEKMIVAKSGQLKRICMEMSTLGLM